LALSWPDQWSDRGQDQDLSLDCDAGNQRDLPRDFVHDQPVETYRNYPEEFLFITKGNVLGIPFDVFLAVVIVILASLVYYETIFGLRLLGLGGNEEASRLAGINTRRIKISTYTICGLLVAIGTMVMISKANTTHSSFGPGTEFTALTAAILAESALWAGKAVCRRL